MEILKSPFYWFLWHLPVCRHLYQLSTTSNISYGELRHCTKNVFYDYNLIA